MLAYALCYTLKVVFNTKNTLLGLFLSFDKMPFIGLGATLTTNRIKQNNKNRGIIAFNILLHTKV